MVDVGIEEQWKKALAPEFAEDYYKELSEFVDSEYTSGNIFPPKELVFEAFNRCKLSDLKVVILGQDPYHVQGQAHGLCFSVPDGVQFPPSLKNILKELDADLEQGQLRTSGNLRKWAEQGCLLLNTTLTVREGEAGSHQKHGWERFTDAVIKLISTRKEHVVFVLWGSFAQKKKVLIDMNKHKVVESVHPSPLSSYRGFFGSKPFSQINECLTAQNQERIIW